MDLLIANYNSEDTNSYLEVIKALLNYLSDKGIETSLIKIIPVDIDVKNELTALKNSKSLEFDVCSYFDGIGDLISLPNSEYPQLNKIIDKYSPWSKYGFQFIIFDKNAIVKNFFGENQGLVTVIKNDHVKNIWHETAHNLGANDHYDIDTKILTCGHLKCLMGWGNLDGDFCDESVEEIKNFLSKHPKYHKNK